MSPDDIKVQIFLALSAVTLVLLLLGVFWGSRDRAVHRWLGVVLIIAGGVLFALASVQLLC